LHLQLPSVYPLQQNLSGNNYNDDDDIETAVNSLLLEQMVSFYEVATLELVNRYEKCLNKLGNYAVE